MKAFPDELFPIHAHLAMDGLAHVTNMSLTCHTWSHLLIWCLPSPQSVQAVPLCEGQQISALISMLALLEVLFSAALVAQVPLARTSSHVEVLQPQEMQRPVWTSLLG